MKPSLIKMYLITFSLVILLLIIPFHANAEVANPPIRGSSINSLTTGSYSITFTQNTLPYGVTWSVYCNNINTSSYGSTIVFNNLPAGTYTYGVSSLAGYTISSQTGSITVNSNVTQNISFSPIPNEYPVIFSQENYAFATGSTWSVQLNGTTLSSTSNYLDFSGLTRGNYSFSVQPPSGYSVTPANGTLFVNNTITQAIYFYSGSSSITFTENGLPTGSFWSVVLDGINLTSTIQNITFTGILYGYHNYSVGLVNYYIATPASGIVLVDGNVFDQVITFSPNASTLFSIYSMVSADPTNLFYFALPEAEEFTVGNSSEIINYASFLFSGQGAVSVSIGTSLMSSDIVAPHTIAVSYTQNTYAWNFNGVNLSANTHYFLNVQRVSGNVEWAYTSPSQNSFNYLQNYWYSGSNYLYIDHFSPNVYSIGYSSNGPNGNLAVTFIEGGLPGGVFWSIGLNGAYLNVASQTINFSLLTPGSYIFTNNLINNYAAYPHTGLISLIASNTSINLTFSPITQPVINSVSSITPINRQTIIITGQGFGSNPNSQYIFSDGSELTSVCFSNTPSIEIKDFGTGANSWSAGRLNCSLIDPVTIFISSWNDTTIILGGFGSALGSTYSISTGDSIQIAVSDFAGLTAYYNTVVVNTTVNPTYSVFFTESGFPNGVLWSVTLNGITNYASSPIITFQNLISGVYSFNINNINYNGITYIPNPASGQIMVSPNSGTSFIINFTPSSAGTTSSGPISISSTSSSSVPRQTITINTSPGFTIVGFMLGLLFIIPLMYKRRKY